MIRAEPIPALASDWYTHIDLPDEVKAFDTPVDHLGVGDSDKVGVLDLDLACVEGTTRITRQVQRGPLYILQPMYIDPVRLDMAFLTTIQLGDGLVQGDRYRMDVHCASHSAVHVTTQAATKIYRMEDNFACQMVNISAREGAFVEYLPDPVIPFRDSRFFQRVRLIVDPTASMIYGEILLPGRVACGEAHVYTLYYTDTEICDPAGRLILADRMKLEPAKGTLHSPGRLGPYDILATLYIVSHRISSKEMLERLYGSLRDPTDVMMAATELPEELGVGVRILGSTSLHIKRAFAEIWNEARMALIGVPAPNMRKG